MSLPMARAGTGWALRTLGTQTSLGSWGILWNGYLKGCKLEDLEMCSGTNRTCTVAMAAAVAAETEGLGMCQVSLPLNFGHAVGHANICIRRFPKCVGTPEGRGTGIWIATGEGQHTVQWAFEAHSFLSKCSFRPWKSFFRQALKFIRVYVPLLFGKLSLFPFSSVQAQLRGHCVTNSRERQCLELFGSWCWD